MIRVTYERTRPSVDIPYTPEGSGYYHRSWPGFIENEQMITTIDDLSRTLVWIFESKENYTSPVLTEEQRSIHQKTLDWYAENNIIVSETIDEIN